MIFNINSTRGHTGSLLVHVIDALQSSENGNVYSSNHGNIQHIAYF